MLLKTEKVRKDIDAEERTAFKMKKISIMKSFTETSLYFLLLPLAKGILGKSLGRRPVV